MMDGPVSVHLDEHVLWGRLCCTDGDVPECSVGDEGPVRVEDRFLFIVLELWRFVRSVGVGLGNWEVCWLIVVLIVIDVIIVVIIVVIIIVIVGGVIVTIVRVRVTVIIV